ncbi:MAG: hypothetical protein DRJ97_02520 [Thermoprotei archaeon]|nr:MAG: hypothetical protein DRJ97_02520 [Thermoprotei archaeon]
MFRFYIETYGCWLNKADSDLMSSLLEDVGGVLVDSPLKADVAVINTCAVRAETERKIVRRLKELEAMKVPKLIVAGCLATYRPALIAKAVPSASLISTAHPEKVVEAALSQGRVVALDEGPRTYLKLPRFKGGARCIAPIAVGCLGACAYCVMPLSRGPLRSYPESEVLRYVREAVEAGAKEVYLVAQDAAAYGLDLGSTLPSLLRRVCNLDGEFMVRVGMMEPSTTLRILDALLDAYSDEKVYKFLHCPVQTGSNKVLELINRRYTVEDFMEIVEAYRSRFPDGSLATDIMVGLPGEEEEDFEATLKLLEAIEPDKVHVARFTPRPLTPAASMDSPPDWVKKERSRKASLLVDQLTLKRNKRWVGRTVKVLVTDPGREGTLMARTETYKPVVLPGGREQLWRWAEVLVIDAHPYYLKATSPHRG